MNATGDAPFLRIRRRGGSFQVDGTPNLRVGQVDLPESLRTGQEIFAEWQWNGAQVTLRTCRYGFAPLYYYATDDEFGVSGSLERLIERGAPADLDEAAVATFLRLGWLVGNDTVFRAIRIVPPNGEVRWSGGAAQVSGGYSFRKAQRLPRHEAVEGFGALFRQAMRRRVSPDVPTALPLSGGRDSRHILLEMHALGCPPATCFTTHDFPPYREGNIKAAAMLCDRLRIPHRVVGQPGSRLDAEVDKNRRTGFAALEHAWWANLFAAISASAFVTYDGLAGDALSEEGADGYLTKEQVELLEQGDLVTLAERIVGNWSWRTSEDTLARILSPEAMQRFARRLAVERVACELAHHLAAANPLSSFNFWNRTRRCGALGPVAIAPPAGIVAITPFLDHDLFDFLASFPAAMLLDRTLHTETIHRMYPEFRDIPFSGDLRMPLQESPWHQRRFLVEAALYVARRGTGELIQRGQTVRRLLALASSGADGLHRRARGWIAPLHLVYLTQLEALRNGK